MRTQGLIVLGFQFQFIGRLGRRFPQYSDSIPTHVAMTRILIVAWCPSLGLHGLAKGYRAIRHVF
jgi:hypothetical protein